jgi:hypothetical protein
MEGWVPSDQISTGKKWVISPKKQFEQQFELAWYLKVLRIFTK